MSGTTPFRIYDITWPEGFEGPYGVVLNLPDSLVLSNPGDGEPLQDVPADKVQAWEDEWDAEIDAQLLAMFGHDPKGSYTFAPEDAEEFGDETGDLWRLYDLEWADGFKGPSEVIVTVPEDVIDDQTEDDDTADIIPDWIVGKLTGWLGCEPIGDGAECESV